MRLFKNYFKISLFHMQPRLKATVSQADYKNFKYQHATGCEAQLAWKCPFMPPPFQRAILTGKVGQTEVFGWWPGFISKGKEEYLSSAILADTPLTKRSDMDHTVLPANYTMSAFPS